MYLEAAPPIPNAVVKVVDTMAVDGVVTPTGLIRGGMLSSLLGMMRCSEFDPDNSLSFVNNPTGWAIGESGLRNQRGSAATVLVALCVMSVCVLVSVGVLTATKKSEGGVGGAVDLLRLPSVALPAVLLLSETGVSSAVTLVLYKASEGSDVVLGLVVLFVLVGYMVLQVVHVLRGGYHVKRVRATRQSVLQYVLDPTHEVVATDERWVRRNFYFVEGRSWPLFSVIEVAAGTLSNVLEGIPLTVSVGGLCAARPGCILVMSVGLLVLLLCVFGMLELVALLLAVIPPTVSVLGLRSRTLEDVIMRGAVDEDDDNAVPMLQLPSIATMRPVAQAPPCTPPSPQQQTSPPTQTAKEVDDEVWAARLIAKVHGREE